MAQKTTEWKGVTGGHTFGQRAMKVIFGIVDVRVCYAILLFVVPFYMIFNHKEYLAIYHYFRQRHNYSVMKSFWATYRNHCLFGQMMFDRFAVYAGQTNFKIDNPDNEKCFLPMLDDPRGCIVASSHVGNPELCGYLLSQNKKRINGLIFGGEALEIQKNRLKIFDENNVRLIPVAQDMSHIFLINEALNDGEVVSLPCDRVFGSDKTVECDFLGGKADFPMGAFVLAVQYNVPAIALFVLKKKAMSYYIRVIPINVPTEGTKREKIVEMTRNFAHILESIVCEYPLQWFNFYEFWKK